MFSANFNTSFSYCIFLLEKETLLSNLIKEKFSRSNTTGATSGAGTGTLPEHMILFPGF